MMIIMIVTIVTFRNTRDGLLVLLDSVLDLDVPIAGDADHGLNITPGLVRFTHRGAFLLVGAGRRCVGDCIGAGK